MTVCALVALSACAMTVPPGDDPPVVVLPDGGGPPVVIPPPAGGVGLTALSATLTGVTTTAVRLRVEMELSVDAAAPRASLHEGLFALELDGGIQYTASPVTASEPSGCPRTGFVSPGASVRCVVAFELSSRARPVRLHYVTPEGTSASSPLPAVVATGPVAAQEACLALRERSDSSAACASCVDPAIEDGWVASEVFHASACGGHVPEYWEWVDCGLLGDLSEACAAAVMVPIAAAMTTCTPCPETPILTPQARAVAVCDVLFDAVVASDACVDCVQAWLAMEGATDPEGHCAGEASPSIGSSCGYLEEVNDACAALTADAFGAVLAGCPACE